MLWGRCRHCREIISFRYPLVELVTALISMGILLRYGLSPEYAVYLAFSSALIVITFIDLKHMIVPDIISLPGIVFGILWNLLNGLNGLLASVGGILIGGGGLLIVAETYRALRRREGLGGGDVKLLAMIGSFFGWQGVLLAILIGSFTGALVGVSVVIVEKKDMKYAIPFGPFLSFGALAFLFWGEEIMSLIGL